MSLRTKFSVLLGVLGLAVLASLIAAWWSLEVVQAEVRVPVRSMSGALAALGHAKRSIEDGANVLNEGTGSSLGVHDRVDVPETAPPPTPALIAACRDHLGLAATALAELSRDEFAPTRAGKTALPNLMARLDEASTLIGAPGFGTASDDRRRAIATLFSLHELIERMEARIVEDTQSVLMYGTELRSRLLLVLGLSLAITVLAIALGMSLIRRWVLRPVQALRTAAARIAAGDFTHRVPLPARLDARDELFLLSSEVNHMAGMVKAMQDERVDRERLAAIGEMVRRLAHNLRNPLGGIRGLAELSRSEVGPLGPVAADIHENQSRIIATVDRFEHWLTDLLTATRPTTVQPEPTPIAPWLEGLVEAHRAAAETRGIGLILDISQCPEVATFDPRHLEHALSALISNAIDAAASAPEGAAASRLVRVESRVTRRESGAMWELRVSDSGLGVPPDLREKIFSPYFTTKRDGSGIGLALALQVIAAHGGQIEVVSPAGASGGPLAGGSSDKGACFIVRIPLNQSLGESERVIEVARIGQAGASGGQDSGSRR